MWGGLRKQRRKVSHPTTSNSGQEEGSKPSTAKAMKGELPNRDVRQKDSVLVRPVVRQRGSREIENLTSLAFAL